MSIENTQQRHFDFPVLEIIKEADDELLIK